MEIRFQPALATSLSLCSARASAPQEPADTVEFRRPGWLGIGWRSATPEQARERLAEGKSVQVRDGSWVPLEQPDDLGELEYFRGQKAEAPSDMGAGLKALAEKGARFANEAELGPFGAYHELEHGRPVTLSVAGRSLKLSQPDDVALAAYFHDAGAAPSKTAPALKTLYESGLDLGGSPLDPPCPVRVTNAQGTVVTTIPDLTQPIDARALRLAAKIGEYEALTRLTQDQLQAVEELARLQDAPFKPEKTWAREPDGSWSDSPGARYRDNEDSSLNFPPLQLGKGSRLELTAKYALESGCDKVQVEARAPGGKWQSLATFTGRSDWRNHTIDLASFDGQSVELRLHLTTDHSNTDDGFSAQAIRVISDGKVQASTDTGEASLKELLALPPAAAELQAIAADARHCGLGIALALSRANATGLGPLAGQIGLSPALALRDVSDAAGPALELARKLAPEQLEASQIQLAEELARKQVDPAPLLELERGLAPPAWAAQGDWRVRETAEGRMWSHGRLPDQSDVSLTTPEFECGASTLLSYRAATRLESNCDFLNVEVKTPGGEWSPLKRHTGNTSTDHEVDLSHLQGQRVQLRFRLVSDHSNPSEGVSLAAIRVVADGRRVLAFDEGKAGHAELRELALSQDAPRLAAIQAAAAQTGSVSAALTLNGRSGELATLVGVQGALELGDLKRPATEVAAYWKAARQLQASFQQPVDLAARSRMTRSLAGSGITPAQLARLARTTAAVAWQPEPSWQQIRENDSLIWRRTYVDNDESSLVSPEIDLTAVQGARAMFVHHYDLESNCDFVHLEAQPVGARDWTTVASYTGRTGDYRDEVVDLSRFDGQKIRLRYRLKSDHSNRNDGYRLGSVVVNGLADLRPPARLDDALKVLASIPAAERDAALERLEEVGRRLGSREAALALWPDLSENRVKLTEQLGMTSALKHAARADQLLESFEFARALCRANGEPADRTRLLGLAEKLLAADLQPEEMSSLKALAAQKPATWSCEAPWKVERGGYGFGRYADNASASLSFPKVGLKGLRDARLQFEMKHGLEQNCDFVRLEARVGDQWQEIDRWTGQANWTERDVDLSRFDGQSLELRLRLAADHSNSGEGASVRAVRLRARADGEPLPRTLAQMPEGTATASDLVDLVCSQPKATRPAMLTELTAMSRSLDSAAGACELWPSAATNPRAVTDLARALGLERARELAPLVKTSADVPRLIGLYEASWRLSMAMTVPPPDAERLDMVKTLMPTGLEAEPVRRLTELVRASEAAPEGVTADKPWRREVVPGRGLTYVTGRYPENASASLTLRRLNGARKLRFEAAYGLEKNCDFLVVEAKNGSSWTELARFDGQSSWQMHELSLNGADEVRFRLQSDHSNSGDGIQLGLIEAGDFRHDPATLRFGALVGVLQNGTLPMVETLARDERLPGAMEIASVCTPWSDLEAARASYRLTRSWGHPVRAEAVGEILREAGANPGLVKPLAQLPAGNAWRVLEFIRSKQVKGGPLEGMPLQEAVESYLAVAVNQVLVDDLDKVLELMLARSAASIGERDKSVIIGGVVVKKKEEP